MIGFVRYWSDLERWVPGGSATLETAFPLVPVGDILASRREVVAPVDFHACVPITIHFDGSIDARSRTEPFKGQMFAGYPGDVIFSKIDVRNGAIAIIPPALSRVVVTSEFPVNVPDEKQVDSRYLALILRSPNFLQLIKALTSGTSGRKRIDSEAFGALEVPLPDLLEQTALLDKYEQAIAAAIALEEKASAREKSATIEFESALGLVSPLELPHQLVQIAQFKDIERWSHEGILDRRILSSNSGTTERYPTVTLGEVIGDLENGWSPQCLNRPAAEDQWGVLKLGAVSFGQFDEMENKALPSKLKPDIRIEVKPGDVLISRANILRLVGACAIVRAARPKLMLCDKIFRVIFLDESQIDPEFLSEVMKTPHVRQQIEAGATGTSPTMKNIAKPALLDLSFPLPQGAEGWQFSES